MERLDAFEVGMYREKWAGMWFVAKEHADYFAGNLDGLIYRENHCLVVWVTLFHERGRKRLPVWIDANPEGSASFRTLDKRGQAALARAGGQRVVYTSESMAIRTTSGKYRYYNAVLPMVLDFSFPKPGLVTMLRGAHKGYSYYIRRIPNEGQRRGCIPGYNMQLTPMDGITMREEGMSMLGDMEPDMREHIYSDLYYSLVHTKPLTIGEGIELLAQGHYVSIALDRRFALSLSRFHKGFDLLYGIAEVGTVSLEGVITFNKGSEDLQQEMQVA